MALRNSLEQTEEQIKSAKLAEVAEAASLTESTTTASESAAPQSKNANDLVVDSESSTEETAAVAKDSQLSLSDRQKSQIDININAEFAKLHEYHTRAKTNTTNAHVEFITKMIISFTTANQYQLENEEHGNLLGDMTAVNNLLTVAETFHNDSNTKNKIALQTNLEEVVNRAEKNLWSKKDIFIGIGMAMSTLAALAAVGVLVAVTFTAIPAAPFIAAACVVGAIGFLAASAIAHYHQSNHTFFGQNVKNHKLMADFVLAASDVFDKNVTSYFNRP